MLSSQPRYTAVRPLAAQPGSSATTTATAAAPPVQGMARTAARVVDPAEYNTLRKLAFYFGLAVIFARFAVLPEVLYAVFHVGTYILYLLAPPACLGALLTGGLERTFRRRAAYYWIAFFAWMLLAIPFSTWRGGSFALIKGYGLYDMMLLVIAGGLAINWKEVRSIFYAIAVAALFNLLTARVFLKTTNGRFTLDDATGTIGNSNDLAAHLILVLPFVLFIVMDPKRNKFFRFACMALLGYGITLIMGTASRGAMLALIAGALFFLWRASGPQRLAFVMIAGLTALAVSAVMPPETWKRLGTLVGKENEEADESMASRGYLFRKSIDFTLEFPLFGVGPNQFAYYEGKTATAAGKLSPWGATHCSWTQVSSECGIPAFIFYVLGLGSAIGLVYRVYKAARAQGHIEIRNACFCYLLGMVGFLVAISFLANAYRFYGPAMVGLAIAIACASRKELTIQAAGSAGRAAF